MWITNERILFEDAFLITLTTKYTQGTEIKVIFLTDVVIETSVAWFQASEEMIQGLGLTCKKLVEIQR